MLLRTMGFCRVFKLIEGTNFQDALLSADSNEMDIYILQSILSKVKKKIWKLLSGILYR